MIIDSNALKIFISIKLIKKSKLITQKKTDNYEFSIINESQLNKINKETQLLLIAIQQHYKTIIFNIVTMTDHDVVLNMS